MILFVFFDNIVNNTKVTITGLDSMDYAYNDIEIQNARFFMVLDYGLPIIGAKIGGLNGTEIEEIKSNAKPLHMHHFYNKSKPYTPKFIEILNKYGIDVDGSWNKSLLPHMGMHPNALYDFMLDNVREFDKTANGDKELFLKLFSAIKERIIDNPDILYKDYWRY